MIACWKFVDHLTVETTVLPRELVVVTTLPPAKVPFEVLLPPEVLPLPDVVELLELPELLPLVEFVLPPNPLPVPVAAAAPVVVV